MCCLWVALTAGCQAVYESLLILMMGTPMYAILEARGDVAPKPVELAAEHPVAHALLQDRLEQPQETTGQWK